jgi:hypothetical protein
MCKCHLANQNLTKFANYSALFPQVQGNTGQEIREPKGNDAIVTRAKTPSPQRQGRLCIDNGDDAIVIRATTAIATMAKTLCIDANNAIKTWVTPPAQGQAATATTLAQQRRRHTCASTMAMMPSCREQQLPLQQWQRCLRIDGNDASLPTSHEVDDIDDDKDAIAMRATMPVEDSNNAITTRATTPSQIKGDDAIVTRETTLS